jgi:hypothetical protein
MIFYYNIEKTKDKFIGFVISRGCTNGRCVYEGPQDGRYYLYPSGGKKYLAPGTPITKARKNGSNFELL